MAERIIIYFLVSLLCLFILGRNPNAQRNPSERVYPMVVFYPDYDEGITLFVTKEGLHKWLRTPRYEES